jgi:ferredoxin
MLSVRHLFGGLPHLTGYQTVSPQGDDCNILGAERQTGGNGDVWLCHNCGDCSTLCPRGAKPGDVLAAVRAATIIEYATPKALAKMVSDPKKLPILLAIPAVILSFWGCCSRWWVSTG